MSPDAMTSGWYYAKAGAPVGQEIGPLSWQELYLLAQDGTLVPADLVWNPKLPRGVTAGQVPGLFPSLVIPESPAAEMVPPLRAPSATGEPAETPAETAPQAVASSPSAETETQDAPAETPAQTPTAETTPAAQPPASETARAASNQVDSGMPESPRSPAESLEPISEPVSVADEPAALPKKRAHSNLPWLVLLLAAAIAAAGLATYFLYLRDLWT